MPLNEIKYQFKVDEDGTIKIVNRKQFEADMKAMFAGKTAIGIFRRARRVRSTPQNSYYWACVIPEVFDGLVDAGYDRHALNYDIVHEMLRNKFLKVDLPSEEFAGEFITVTKSTTELTVAEMSDYISEIHKWAAEFLNIVITSAGDQKEIHYQ